MTYLRTPAESPLFDAAEAAMGYLPNYTKIFALAPEVYPAWQKLGATVRAGMDLRRYQLVTLAAARRLGSDYCSLAHAKMLREKFYSAAELNAIISDHRSAGLDPVDVAILDFADLVAADPTQVTAAHADELRAFGLSEEDIFQIVLAVNLRRFFSGVLSAVGAQPDPAYDALDPELRAALPSSPSARARA